MLKTCLEDVMDHWGSFNIPFILLFSEIIPCEESTHLMKVQFVTNVFLFLLEGFNHLQLSTYDKVKGLS